MLAPLLFGAGGPGMMHILPATVCNSFFAVTHMCVPCWRNTHTYCCHQVVLQLHQAECAANVPGYVKDDCTEQLLTKQCVRTQAV